MNNKWNTRPEGEPILCDYINCAFGLGQAGNGRCPGDWTKSGRECPKFITDKEFDRQQKEESP